MALYLLVGKVPLLSEKRSLKGSLSGGGLGTLPSWAVHHRDRWNLERFFIMRCILEVGVRGMKRSPLDKTLRSSEVRGKVSGIQVTISIDGGDVEGPVVEDRGWSE